MAKSTMAPSTIHSPDIRKCSPVGLGSVFFSPSGVLTSLPVQVSFPCGFIHACLVIGWNYNLPVSPDRSVHEEVSRARARGGGGG